jgi:hypothetical protein
LSYTFLKLCEYKAFGQAGQLSKFIYFSQEKHLLEIRVCQFQSECKVGKVSTIDSASSMVFNCHIFLSVQKAWITLDVLKWNGAQ